MTNRMRPAWHLCGADRSGGSLPGGAAPDGRARQARGPGAALCSYRRGGQRGRAPARRGESHMRAHRAGHRLTTIALALTLAVLAACSSADGSDDAEPDDAGEETAAADVELPAGYEGYTTANYADDAHWLCKPGIADDVCSRDLDATSVAADGTTEVIDHQVAEDPPIDCFYVYPTTSFDQGPNSDWEPAEAEEIHTVYNQAARLTSTCRVFAPVYRQATLSSIGGGGGGGGGETRDPAL